MWGMSLQCGYGLVPALAASLVGREFPMSNLCETQRGNGDGGSLPLVGAEELE